MRQKEYCKAKGSEMPLYGASMSFPAVVTSAGTYSGENSSNTDFRYSA